MGGLGHDLFRLQERLQGYQLSPLELAELSLKNGMMTPYEAFKSNPKPVRVSKQALPLDNWMCKPQE
jgi:hypothetical protein